MRVLGFLLHRADERGGGLERQRSTEDVLGQVDGHRAAFLRRRVGDEPAGTPDVALRGDGREAGVAFRCPGIDKLLHNRADRGRRDVEVAAPRAQGLREVFRIGGRRAHDDDGALGRLLDGFEQCVRCAVGEPVRLVDDHDPPRRHRRPGGRARDDVAHRVDRDG